MIEEMLGRDLGVIKTHLLSHAFDDLLCKGPLSHYTTTFGENGHPKFKAMFPRTSGRTDTFQEEVFLNNILPQYDCAELSPSYVDLMKLTRDSNVFRIV
jgi:hypothetical protein